MTPILGTGLSGLIGSKLVKDFSGTYSFQNLDITSEQPVDITKYDQVYDAFAKSEAQYVVHCAAFTDVTKAWEQLDDKTGLAFRVNVNGTENIAKAAAATQKHLIHLSTAYIFNGEKDGMYTELDAPNPIEWYGQTKVWAEEAVQNSEASWTILRIDQPFRSDTFPRLDVAHKIISGLQNNTLYPQFTNHYFGPTFIDDFVKVIDWVIRTKTTGIFHASSGEKWSDFAFAEEMKKTLKLGGDLKQGNLDEYLRTLNRPYQRNTSLDCTKLKAQLDFVLTPIQKALAQILP